jgi:hypothetical protein
MKIRSMGTEFCMRTDGRTDGQKDMTELIFAFYDFAKGPKNIDILSTEYFYALTPAPAHLMQTVNKKHSDVLASEA